MAATPVWRPWDADDDEYDARLAVKALIPDPLRPALQMWVSDTVEYLGEAYQGYINLWLPNLVQSMLQINLRIQGQRIRVDDFVQVILSGDDRFVMRAVDLLVKLLSDDPEDDHEDRFAELEAHLDLNASAVTITHDPWSERRITRRLPEGVETVASGTVQAASRAAGENLSKAWKLATQFNPDPSSAMSHAVKAVEAAAARIVTPRDGRQQLGRIVAAIRDNEKWDLVFSRRDDGHPDLRSVLISMLETLAFAQSDRHGDKAAPTPTQAMGHVQLASTLVSWFSTGVVIGGE